MRTLRLFLLAVLVLVALARRGAGASQASLASGQPNGAPSSSILAQDGTAPSVTLAPTCGPAYPDNFAVRIMSIAGFPSNTYLGVELLHSDDTRVFLAGMSDPSRVGGYFGMQYPPDTYRYHVFVDQNMDNRLDDGGVESWTTITVPCFTVSPITIFPSAVMVGTPIATTASFNDPINPHSHTAFWDWDDRTTSSGIIVGEANGVGTVEGSHTYTTAGIYNITVRVSDDTIYDNQFNPHRDSSSVIEELNVYNVYQSANAGDRVTTDPDGSGASASEPVQTSVTSANEGIVSIMETDPDDEEIPGSFALLGQQIDIEAPTGTAETPLVLVFRLDSSRLGGAAWDTIQVFRGQSQVADCTATSPAISPDPCVANRVLLADGDVEITVLTSHASVWSLAKSTRYNLRGFYPPVDMQPVMNTVKGGATVPIKFEAFAGATELTDPAIVAPLGVAQITCPSQAAQDAIEVSTIGGTRLHYDTSEGQFIYNWQTPKRPGTCYSVSVSTRDGSSLPAVLFKLK